MIQGSPEWLALRAGKITGSRFRAVMALHKRTGKPNAPRLALVRTLADEIATGVPEYVEPNEYMAHGTAMEPLARSAYEFIAGCECVVPAFIQHPSIEYVGFSPDGLVGGSGMVEIKCPALEGRHMRTVESQACPEDYWPQVQGGMWTAEREWCDFVSYFQEISIEVVRVYRDDAYITRLTAECAAVWSDVQTALEEMKA